MPYYRVNKNTDANPNGNNEVHEESCIHYNQLRSYDSLGYHASCQSAVAKAKSMGYSRADGCIKCSKDCHKG